MTKKARRTADQIRVHKLAADVASLPLSLLSEFATCMQTTRPAEASYLGNALRAPILITSTQDEDATDKPMSP